MGGVCVCVSQLIYVCRLFISRPVTQSKGMDALLIYLDLLLTLQAHDEVAVLAAQQQAALNALAASVAPVVVCDAERALAATASSAAAPVPTTGSAFKPLRGYNVHCLAQDQRFRALEALSELGLLHTPAACAALAALPPPQPQRRDTLTTPQLQQTVAFGAMGL